MFSKQDFIDIMKSIGVILGAGISIAVEETWRQVSIKSSELIHELRSEFLRQVRELLLDLADVVRESAQRSN